VPVILPLDTTFTKITDGPVATDQGISTAAAWAITTRTDSSTCSSREPTPPARSANRLYHNEGQGRFTVVTAGPVAEDRGVSMGRPGGTSTTTASSTCSSATAPRSGAGQPTNYLYRGLGGGAFERITRGELLTGMRWSGPAAWVDYDRDGLLDLFFHLGDLRARSCHGPAVVTCSIRRETARSL